MKYAVSALIVLAVGIGTLVWMQHGGSGAPKGGTLVVYCAAGVRQPVETAAAVYRKEFDTAADMQYGGSGTLLSSIRTSKTGDLFICADAATLADARNFDLIREVIPLASQKPVIAVAKGNPKGIESLDDLRKDGVKFALCNPEAASIGKVMKKALGERWDALSARAAVHKPTVTDIAGDVQIGTVDAAVVWDATVAQFKKSLDAVELPEMAKYEETTSIAVLASCRQPASALRFARYLAAPEKGAPIFAAAGLRPVKGDAWAAKPKLTLYSGGVNRPAIEKTLKEFADREGVDLNTVFNGCGILCAQMRTMANTPDAKVPDAYYACDICFVPPVADLYPSAVVLTETDIMLAVPKGNPKNIQSIADLAKPGLKVGVCNSEQSTLGFMTKGILRDTGNYDAIMKNVCSQVPTADLLVNQLRTGSLDAAIVYIVNAKPAKDQVDTLPIAHPGAKAMQPFAVSAKSPNAQLANRLLDYLRANRARSEAAGFRWRDDPALSSRDIQVPSWLQGK